MNMDERTVGRVIEATHWPRTVGTVALGMLALFLLSATISQLKGLRFIGSGVPATNTITVTGEGEEFAVPDIAEFNATVMETGTNVKSAQDKATKKINDIYAFLKEADIDEKDIRTADYSAGPRYEWRTQSCPLGRDCSGGRQVLTGYEVSQTLEVKVRDTAKAGDILAGVGEKGVSSVSGLTFTVDDEDEVEAKARDEAIADAKTKAQVLAKSLGVSLVRIVGFAESGATPLYMQKVAYDMAAAEGARSNPAPEIPTGQNKVVSTISLTYEIQ